jgi:hypothetical protein
VAVRENKERRMTQRYKYFPCCAYLSTEKKYIIFDTQQGSRVCQKLAKVIQ